MSIDAELPKRSRRLLVVDDEKEVLKLLKTFLTRARYEVVTCETAAQALQTLMKESFDCLITDAVMPDKNGFDLIKAVRQDLDCKNIPILMLTRKRLREDVKNALDLGVTDYVVKPIDEPLLLDKVALCLKNGFTQRHIAERFIPSEQGKAKLSLRCQISVLSETVMKCIIPFQMPLHLQCEIHAPLFDEIGIQTPLMKLISCTKRATPAPHTSLYEATFTFLGVPEVDLQKIRIWLNREEIRRRK